MPAASAQLDTDAVARAVRDVPDPELPAVTIGMLGMVHDLRVGEGGHVHVELLPTYSGCPATEMIERDVVTAARALPGVTDVTVRFRFDPPWTADRIDAEGRDRLREFGIAPPGGAVHGAARPEGRRALPVVTGPPVHDPATAAGADPDPRPCPYCGSGETTRESRFGPTPCRDLRFCAGCRQPFEAFKP